MTTILNIPRDVAGVPTYAPVFADDCFSTTLAAGFAQSFTVPSNFKNWIAVFSYEPGASVWVSTKGAASYPGGSFVSTSSEQNPPARLVKGGDVISMITSSSTHVEVGVILYAQQ